MSLKKIALTSNTSRSVYIFRKALIQVLIERGYTVHILANPDETTPKLEKLGAFFHPLNIDAKGLNPLKDIRSLLRYVSILREIRPNCILAFTIKPVIYAGFAARWLNIPIISTITGLGTAFMQHGLLKSIAIRLYKMALSKASAIFFQNPEDLDYFQTAKIVDPKRSVLVNGSGVDLNHFCSAQSLPSTPFRFLMVSRPIYDKGIKEYVNAAKKLKELNGDLEFQLAGPSRVENRTMVEPEVFEKWISEGPLNYLGFQEDPKVCMERAHVVVLPSYREGLPRSLMEAAAMAKPIIATDVPGCRQVVDDGVTGLLCRPKDHEDLARTMLKMIGLHKEGQLGKMGLAAREKAKREFDQTHTIEKYLDVLASRL